MGKVLAIVNRAISTYLINKAGFKISQAHTGAVTLIQRFGSALNLNLHFHVLFIDGVFSPKSNGDLRFHRVNAPTSKELTSIDEPLPKVDTKKTAVILATLRRWSKESRGTIPESVKLLTQK